VTKNRHIAVLIVGAGPTGLTLACDLARRKVSFRIVDKTPEYFPDHGARVSNPEVWKCSTIWV
jgi:2-polyprenyl-6-methoxyphenol hydroxylase-like FAD-dependent oxidoreductase